MWYFIQFYYPPKKSGTSSVVVDEWKKLELKIDKDHLGTWGKKMAVLDL